MPIRSLLLMIVCTVTVTCCSLVPIFLLTGTGSADKIYQGNPGNFYDSWNYILLDETRFYEARFSGGYRSSDRSNPGRCVAWFSSHPITVYYRFASTEQEVQVAQWNRWPDTRRFTWPGFFEYRFVRETEEPTTLIFNLSNDVSGKLSGCGDFGLPTKDDFLFITPFDAVTGLVGIPPLGPVRSSRRPSEGQSGVPEEFSLRAGGDQIQILDINSYQWSWVQQYLNQGGFDAGLVDGVPGPNTADAISRWQASKGVLVTGILTNQQFQEMTR